MGPWAKLAVDWLTDNGAWFFDWLSNVLAAVIDALLFVLQTPHPLIIVAAMTGLSWWFRRSFSVAAFTVFGLLLILNQGYWEETTETLPLVVAATAFSMAVGIPLGITSARRRWRSEIMRPVH